MKKQYRLFTFVLVFALTWFQGTSVILSNRQNASAAENLSRAPVGLTAVEWSSITRQIEANRYRIQRGERGQYRAGNQAQSFHAGFSTQGVHVAAPQDSWH